MSPVSAVISYQPPLEMYEEVVVTSSSKVPKLFRRAFHLLLGHDNDPPVSVDSVHKGLTNVKDHHHATSHTHRYTSPVQSEVVAYRTAVHALFSFRCSNRESWSSKELSLSGVSSGCHSILKQTPLLLPCISHSHTSNRQMTAAVRNSILPTNYCTTTERGSMLSAA